MQIFVASAPTEMDRLPTEDVLIHKGSPKLPNLAPVPVLHEEEESGHGGHRFADRTEEEETEGDGGADQEPFFLTQVAVLE